MADDFPRFTPVPLDLSDDPLPLVRWEDGTVRVVNSRVQVEFLVWKFQAGETPEEISDSLETVELPDIYAIKAFYLRHKDALDAYAAEIERQGEAMRMWRESQPEYQEFMQRLDKRISDWKERTRASAARR